MVKSIHNQIEMAIRKKRRGSLIFPGDFKRFGQDNAVKMALSRLAKSKLILRLAHGIYLYPKIDAQMGVMTPSIEHIAAAVAQRDSARIIPSGPQAMQMLGFTTQIPLKLTYLTDGSPRKLQVGRRSVTLKRTSPKQMAMKGKICILVVQGLQALGKEQVTAAIISQVADALKRENPAFLNHDILLAPAWIAKIMRGAIMQQTT